MRLKIDILPPFGQPGNALVRHSILFLKHAAHEDVSSRLEVRSSHTLTNQVLRLTNAALRIDENEAVTETSVGEYRQRGPRESAISRHKVRRGIEFAHVIRVVLSHRPMSILRAIARIRDKPDSVSLDGSIGQWTDQLVVAAGECKFDVTQGSTRFQIADLAVPMIVLRLRFSPPLPVVPARSFEP